ncbi:MAG: hypothetical protein KDA05_10185 [Phycisphaerales bacterium]|nr:hypothetical protein [Phycisphaerales bacterium]MCB9840086.1 hypothetical protein [Phycisphaeraceae bacterium]
MTDSWDANPDDPTPGRLSDSERATRLRLDAVLVVGVMATFGIALWLRAGWFIPIGVVGWFAGVVLAGHRLGRRSRREVEAQGFKVCLKCRYGLVEQKGDAHAAAPWLCPECGERYDAEALERSWKWTYSWLFIAPERRRPASPGGPNGIQTPTEEADDPPKQGGEMADQASE